MVGLDVTSGTYYEQNVFYLHSMFNSTSNLITVNEHMNVIMHFEYMLLLGLMKHLNLPHHFEYTFEQ